MWPDRCWNLFSRQIFSRRCRCDCVGAPYSSLEYTVSGLEAPLGEAPASLSISRSKTKVCGIMNNVCILSKPARLQASSIRHVCPYNTSSHEYRSQGHAHSLFQHILSNGLPSASVDLTFQLPCNGAPNRGINHQPSIPQKPVVSLLVQNQLMPLPEPWINFAVLRQVWRRKP